MPRASMNVPRSGPGPDGGIVTQRYTQRAFILPGTQPATAGNWGVVFFLPRDGTFELVSITERHITPGNDAGAVTAMLTKVPSGTALASGTAMLASGLDLKATADTVQSGTLSTTPANTRLDSGDGAAIALTGTPTALASVIIETVWKRI